MGEMVAEKSYNRQNVHTSLDPVGINVKALEVVRFGLVFKEISGAGLQGIT